MMDGKYILISGSASRCCQDGKLDVTLQFVRGFAEEVLMRGGGIVVLAGEEGQQQMSGATPAYSTGWPFAKSNGMPKGPHMNRDGSPGWSCATKFPSPR